MALHKIELYPVSHYIGSTYRYPVFAYDKDINSYAYQLDTTNSSLLLNELQGNIFEQYISQNASIIALRAKMYMSGGVSHSLRFVADATSASSYTDCGDGSISFTAVEGWNTVEIPQGTIYCKNNIDKLINNKFGLRLYTKAKNTRIYEAYVELEYSLPDITVTTNSSPAEGGTVTGGGTYESGSTVTATATPNSGYIFSHWLVNGANAGSSNPISGTLTANTTVTAVFEKSGVNNIFIGTAQPKEIYIGTQKVKGIYVGTKAIYET